jgi:serine/threonine protein kinase
VNEVSPVASKVCAVCGARYPADALFCPTDGAPLQSANGTREADDAYIGQEISGHIEIRQLVGIGAMGRVYRAFQKGIDRDVAVKILHRELSANAQLVTRFTRESKVASRLQHPNVVSVLLAGQLPDRALYMVMEYLDGLSLQSALAGAGGALNLPRALHIALQLCEAAGEAHAQGIVHRDLKPENVMLVKRGSDPDFVKVLDFGIARINWGEQSVATAAGLIFGTARYISPEGAQGNAVGPASDVYAIATLLFQMLAGRTPFEGDQAVGLLVQQIHDAPPDLRSIPRAEYVPAPLADVIMANLAKDPKARAEDARAFGHAILDAAKASGLSPDDISRPMLHRKSAMQLPPVERTRQLDVAAELAERLAPALSSFKPNGSHVDRAPGAATTKWEPPAEFQAKLADAIAHGERASGVITSAIVPSQVPAPASRPRMPSNVDETLDDASAEPPPAAASAPATLATPPPTLVEGPPSVPSVPRTLAQAERTERTQYTPPAPSVARPASDPGRPSTPASEPPSGRGPRFLLFVILCFVLGAGIAAGVAWKMGKLGGDVDGEDRFVTRATDAMYKNRFVEPAGDNVREITDEGLRRWPGSRRLIDVRSRAASALVTKAQAQRSSGDVADALSLARLAHELDPSDASAKRLVDQYEAEMQAFATPSAPPLERPPPTPAPPAPLGNAGKPTPAAAPAAQAGYKVLLEIGLPHAGGTDLTARVAPPKGAFDQPTFVITGPGVTAGARVPASSPVAGVFRATFAFPEAGAYDVVFTTQVDGKVLRATRVLATGKPATPRPPETAAPTPSTTPAPSASVKWM